jgi:hypothetical protein
MVSRVSQARRCWARTLVAEEPALSAHSVCSQSFFPCHGAARSSPTLSLILHTKIYIVGASAYAEDTPCTFPLWTLLGVRRAKKSSSCATMPLPSPRSIDSNSLEGGIGVFQRAYSEGCFFPNLPPSPVGDTPFHFIHISFPRLRSCAGANLTGPSCEGPPVFKRNHTMRELSPIWRQHAYIQMPGLP